MGIIALHNTIKKIFSIFLYMYTKTIKSEYDIQAENFINKHCLTIKKNFMACKPYFENEKESRNVYHITIRDTRAKKEIYFDFGASIVDTKKGITPSDYTILAGLYTDTGDSFEDFCSCF